MGIVKILTWTVASLELSLKLETEILWIVYLFIFKQIQFNSGWIELRRLSLVSFSNYVSRMLQFDYFYTGIWYLELSIPDLNMFILAI